LQGDDGISTMGARNVANIAHSIAELKLVLGKDAMNILHKCDKNAKWLVKEGILHHAANSAWACATLGVELPVLFAQLNKNAKWLLEEGIPQHVGNSVWACATSHWHCLLSSKNAKWLLNEGKPQNVTNAVWAYATLGVEAATLFKELDTNAKWLLEEGGPRAVANSV
jgi:hypothetical protein